MVFGPGGVAAAENNPVRQAANPAAPAARLFARENLVAWCIVPFDRKKRGPVERVEMLRRLGFRRYAYDWRDEHLPTFDTEVAELQRHGIELTAVWFPALDAHGRELLAVLKKRQVKTQLWVTGGGEPTKTAEEQRARIIAEANRIRPIAEAAAAQGCTVALYNHGGWFGEPDNQLAILEALRNPAVGIVYNLHHGHSHLDQFAQLLKKLQPHLLALNLNGMVRGGDQSGRKILPLGAGDLDLELLQTIQKSGYTGPIGILGHTADDAEERLRDNLDGLDWLLPQLDGKKPGPRPKYRTPIPAPAAAATAGPAPAGALAEGQLGKALDTRVARAEVSGRPEYREPPLTIECRARLFDRNPYNILIAQESKSSGTHWELFTMAGSGKLTAYLPGMTPDHVLGDAVVTDGEWHDLAMIYEARRVRLFVDGQIVADTAVASRGMAPQAGGLAIGSLVTHEIGCAGLIDEVRITKGIRDIARGTKTPFQPDERTIGLWRFDEQKGASITDAGVLKNAARVVSAQRPPVSHLVEPPPGLQHTLADDRLRARLIDRARDEVLMAIRTDPEGRIFVGGREGVFVYEPASAGGYLPRRKLYHFPQDSIIIGLEWSGDDLFVLTSSALYVLPEGRVTRGEVRPQRLLWGLPLDLHVSFHCLAWGPEGDLYLTHGDPLLQYGDWSRPDHWGHWTLHLEPGDRQVPYTGAGSVLRLRMGRTPLSDRKGRDPGGSAAWRVDAVEVVAGGLRGPVGLAFDRDWNLFTNDNDHESMADRYAPARLLHVTPHIDFGWPRGWMASKSPDRADLIEPVSAEMGRGVPCDQIFYDDPALPEEYRNRLFLARWDRFAVTTYPLIPRGASFSTRESVFLTGQNNARPVGIGAGHDGRLFVTSLYLPGNVASPYCYSDLIAVEPAQRQSTTTPATFNPVTATADQLWSELENPSWLRREWAHQEILRRGGALLDEAVIRLEKLAGRAGNPSAVSLRGADQTAGNHLIWLAAAGRSSRGAGLLCQLAKQGPAPLRWQALRALCEVATHPDRNPGSSATDGPPPEVSDAAIRSLFVAGLNDANPRIRLAALAYFFDPAVELPLREVAHAGETDDTYIRQTAARLLAQRAAARDLTPLTHSSDAALRLVGVLAAGLRLTVPPLHEVPPAALALSLPPEGAFFKLKLPFADSPVPVNLMTAGRAGSFTTAQLWKMLADTNGSTEDQEQLFALLVERLADTDRRVALQAAWSLWLLRDPRSEPLIDRTRQQILLRDLAHSPRVSVNRVWFIGPFADDPAAASSSRPPEGATIDLTARYAGLAWTEVAIAESGLALPAAQRPASAYACFRAESLSRQTAIVRSDAEIIVALWHNGRPIAPIESADPAGEIWLLDLQPGGNDLLVRLRQTDSPKSVRIELQSGTKIVATLPERLDSNLLAERLRNAAQSDSPSVPREFADVDWPERIKAGNPNQGRRLFGTLGCAKCHAITADQKGGGGPSLADARRRFTLLHLVESVLLPKKQVAEAFRATNVVTTAGKVFTGLVVTDEADRIELLLPDATRTTIPKAEIDERSRTDTSPMPEGLVRTVAELQDLLAYLLSENPLPP
jgi:putative heme-binding domain-containing protein